MKLDGHRLQALSRGGHISLLSRREASYTVKFPSIARALKELPDGTVLDGELTALDDLGRPSLSLLQNYISKRSPIVYFPFDILYHRGRDLTRMDLSERRKILRKECPTSEHVILSEVLDTSAAKILAFVRANRLEGVIAKRKDSCYEPGRRSGKWQKMRVNLGQEFVVGGYLPSELGVDSLVIGYYRDGELRYAGRVRAGLIPVSRRQIARDLQKFIADVCPFCNLPERGPGQWGEGLTEEKMAKVIWLRPVTVAQVDFLEWTSAERLRHTKFVAMRYDKDALTVQRET